MSAAVTAAGRVLQPVPAASDALERLYAADAWRAGDSGCAPRGAGTR